MRIHKVELRNVRQIKEVTLDVSSPLTVIAGPNGVGKSTIQSAILVAMFQSKKETRDSLISRFDPSSPPTAILEFSREGRDPTIRLSRRLTDDTGEWKEGAATIKQKGKALEKLQESLPICAEAAALLLWGLQEGLGAVLTDFPQDGHTLLTAATIKGLGRDPKQIIEELEDEFKKAKRGGKDPGALTRAESLVKQLEDEFERAREAQQTRISLTQDFDKAKAARDHAQRTRGDARKRIDQLGNLERLLEKGLKALKEFEKFEEKQKEWDGLDSEIARAQRTARGLEEELDLLRKQFRVARDRALAERIGSKRAQIELAEKAERKRDDIEKKIRLRRRPEKRDVDELIQLNAAITESKNRREASGLHFDLSALDEATTVRISEDNAIEKPVTLVPGMPVEGIVGSLVVSAGNLRVAARGKEDVAGHTRSIQNAQQSIAILLNRFAVENEAKFQESAEEGDQLREDLKDAKTNLDKSLTGSSLEILRSDLVRLESARRENQVAQQEVDECSGKQLPSEAELDKKLSAITAKLDDANRAVKTLLAKRPTDDQKLHFQTDYAAARTEAAHAIAAFKDADSPHRDPSSNLLGKIKEDLRSVRDAFDRLNDPTKSPENEVARLAGELKRAGPERAVATIDGELVEARSLLHRQQVLQSARELLVQRIQEKINEMTADVPRELGQRISKHLADLTGGAYGRIVLAERLDVKAVYDGMNQEQWDPVQLSHGERHQTALAVKIAVARALVETCGPVFIILDDSLMSFDPDRRAATEQLLTSLVADEKLQVILLTCHTDWALNWKARAPAQINYIELAQTALYYRPLTAPRAG